jgi:hypothetical protein
VRRIEEEARSGSKNRDKRKKKKTLQTSSELADRKARGSDLSIYTQLVALKRRRCCIGSRFRWLARICLKRLWI